MYYGARYYDPRTGQFMSPDTIVPDATNLFDYNRYMYTRGNPLRYADPTGHYSDEEIMQHYGCGDWACVEAIFGDGGAMAGMRGWLFILMAAQNGDAVSILATSNVNGQNVANWTTGLIHYDNGQISVLNVASRPDQSSNNVMSWASLGGDTFASFAFLNNNTDTFGDSYLLGGSSGLGSSINNQDLDCSHVDCVALRLSQGSKAATAATAGCLAFANPCAGVAGTVGTGLSVAEAAWAGYRALDGEGSWASAHSKTRWLSASIAFGATVNKWAGVAVDLASYLVPE